MPEFSMVLATNNRSKAYLQTLAAEGILPARVLLLREGAARLPEQTLHDKAQAGQAEGRFLRRHAETGIAFDEKESLTTTLERHGIPADAVDTLDVNSEAVVAAVAALPGRVAVYSGPGGSLLKRPILSQGKRLLHVHAGRLPAYRGSTTIYYSCLLEGKTAASAIFMEEELDAGPVLLSMEFPLASGEMDFDYLVDPAMRARVLVECLRDLEGLSRRAAAQPRGGNTFFIMHPVLRHLALLKAGRGGTRRG